MMEDAIKKLSSAAESRTRDVFELMFKLWLWEDHEIDGDAEWAIAFDAASDGLLEITEDTGYSESYYHRDPPSVEFTVKGDALMKQLVTMAQGLIAPNISKSIEIAEKEDLMEPPSY